MTGGAGALSFALWGSDFLYVAWTLYRGRDRDMARWRRAVTTGAVTGLAGTLLSSNWTGAGFCAAILVLLFGDWWRRNGKRVSRQLGAKSRAVLAAVVEKWREAGTPLPEGVRA